MTASRPYRTAPDYLIPFTAHVCLLSLSNSYFRSASDSRVYQIVNITIIFLSSLQEKLFMRIGNLNIQLACLVIQVRLPGGYGYNLLNP